MFASGPPPPLLLLSLTLLASPSLPPPFRAPAVAADRRYDHQVLGSSMAWPEPYVARDVIHSRFQVTRDGRVMLASPRFRPGVPFTLGSFRATAASRAVVEPDVRPLPPEPRLHRVDAAGADAGDKATAGPVASPPPPPLLVNVVDLHLDEAMGVLWLLDAGTVDTMTDSPKRLAPAKIVRLDIYDNDDDDDVDDDCAYEPKVPYQTFEIKTERPRGGGGGGSYAVGTDTSCLQYLVTFRPRAAEGGHFALVSDAARSSVLVLNTVTGDQWSIDFPERSLVEGATRDVMFMVSLHSANGRAALYVTFMSGCRVYSVNLEHLDQCTAASRPSVVEVGRKPYRIAVLGSDAGSVMYFRRPAENEIWSWDVNCPFQPANFRLVSVGRDCRAPVHVTPGYGGFVFVLANNFADYVRNETGSLGAYTLVQPVSVLPPKPTDAPRSSAAPNASTTTAASTEADGCTCPPD